MHKGTNTKIWHPELSNIQSCMIGDYCIIHSHVWIGNGVIIGDHCRVQAFSFIPSGVILGHNVFIGPRVTFTNDKYPPASSSDEWEQTIVHDNVSICAGAVILPGVTIGEGARIGAGAVVTKDVAPNTTVVGNPARLFVK